MLISVTYGRMKSFSFLRRIVNHFLKMDKNSGLAQIKIDSEATKQTVLSLKQEINQLNSTLNDLKASFLREENNRLTEAIEEARRNLITAEIKNGTKQVPIPVAGQATIQCQKPELDAAKSEPTQNEPVTVAKVQKPQKEKPVKEKKQPAAKPPVEEAPIDVGRLDLRIGHVLDVQRHPDADGLYVLKINCGDEQPRIVCSGLVKHIPMEELSNRFVVVLCNLKPAKMRGIVSEAMVMCASTPEKVEVLSTPQGVLPGEHVLCEGYAREADPVMNPKKKIFETVAPDLHTDGELNACYKGKRMHVEGKGFVLAQTLKNVSVK